MLKKLVFFLFIFANFLNPIFAEKEEIDVKKLSEAIGHIIGKNLEEFDFNLDIKQMIKGIKKGSLKRSTPMTEDECFEALATLQQKANKKKASKNLQIAENFLLENQKDPNIIEIEKNKLQYKQIKPGKKGYVESYHTPIVKITGRYLDGKVFTKLEESINLNETLIALKKAIIGMRLHEKRKIFVHPDFAFGKNYPHLNSLIIFDIEVIDLDAKINPLNEIANPKNIPHENHTF